jgi:hypothetical protein
MIEDPHGALSNVGLNRELFTKKVDSDRSFAGADHESVRHRQHAHHQCNMGHHCQAFGHISDAFIEALMRKNEEAAPLESSLAIGALIFTSFSNRVLRRTSVEPSPPL